MKRVIISAYQVALVFKRGVYQKMIREGTYWFWNKQVHVYDISQPFYAPVELNILLQDETLRNAVDVVEVKDQELVLHFENGLLRQVLSAGRFAFWKGPVKNEFVKANTANVDIEPSIAREMLQNRLLLPFVRSMEVASYEKGMLFIDGKFNSILESGTYYWWKNSISIHVVRMDVRQQQLEINGQEVLTKDKAALRINAWAQYKVSDLEKAVLKNKEYDKQLYTAIQLAIRAFVGGLSFDELLDKKEHLAAAIMNEVQLAAAVLGVEVYDIGIRDIVLPGDVKEIMGQVLVAEKKAQANSIMRREETASTRSLLNTARLMEGNAMLWKLKEMEYVEKIAEKISTISVSGNGMLIEQLKQLFLPQK